MYACIAYEVEKVECDGQVAVSPTDSYVGTSVCRRFVCVCKTPAESFPDTRSTFATRAGERTADGCLHLHQKYVPPGSTVFVARFCEPHRHEQRFRDQVLLQ